MSGVLPDSSPMAEVGETTEQVETCYLGDNSDATGVRRTENPPLLPKGDSLNNRTPDITKTYHDTKEKLTVLYPVFLYLSATRRTTS